MFSLKSCPQQGQHNTKSVFWDSFCEIIIVARGLIAKVKVTF